MMKPHRLLPTVLISWLFLSANAAADFADEFAAYKAGDSETAVREQEPLAEECTWKHPIGLIKLVMSEEVFVRWMIECAERDNANAQYELASMYRNGEGVPQDDKQALQWYTKAAEQDNAEAQYNLGFMYRNGKGVPQDDKQAFQWYTKAAEQGHVTAQANLGFMYLEGEGVPQDEVYAFMWLHIASTDGRELEREIGVELAREMRDILALGDQLLPSNFLEEVQRLTTECVKKDYKNC